MAIITAIKPLPQPIEFKHNTTITLESSKPAKLAGIAVVVVTLIFYTIFSPFGVAK